MEKRNEENSLLRERIDYFRLYEGQRVIDRSRNGDFGYVLMGNNSGEKVACFNDGDVVRYGTEKNG